MFDKAKSIFSVAVSAFGATVFLDSLRFKFTDHPNTQEIFGRLNEWAASLGAPGLFGHTGLFSQYVIGSAELAASALLLLGLAPGLRRLQTLGALIGFAVMSGAVSFHLFTPLGIDPNNDGGGLFAAAAMLWAATGALLLLRREDLMAIAREVGRVFVPGRPAPRVAPAATLA